MRDEQADEKGVSNVDKEGGHQRQNDEGRLELLHEGSASPRSKAHYFTIDQDAQFQSTARSAKFGRQRAARCGHAR